MARLTAVGPQDEPALAAFLAAFPGERRDERFWAARLALWWERNPALAPGAERGWTLRDAGGAIAGFLGRVPMAARLGGADATLWGATTWRVLPAARAQSLELLFALLGATRTPLLFTTPNAHARRVMDRLRFVPVPAGDDVVSTLPAGGAEAPEPRARRLTDEDGPRIDRLWAERGPDAGTAVRRDAGTLRWYCSEPCPKTLLGALDGEELRGHAIVERLADGTVVLRDLWAPLDDADTVDVLCRGARDEARRAGAAALHVPPLDPRIGARLRALGAVQHPAPPPTGRVRAARDQLAALRPPGAYLTGLLGDTGL